MKKIITGISALAIIFGAAAAIAAPTQVEAASTVKKPTITEPASGTTLTDPKITVVGYTTPQARIRLHIRRDGGKWQRKRGKRTFVTRANGRFAIPITVLGEEGEKIDIRVTARKKNKNGVRKRKRSRTTITLARTFEKKKVALKWDGDCMNDSGIDYASYTTEKNELDANGFGPYITTLRPNSNSITVESSNTASTSLITNVPYYLYIHGTKGYSAYREITNINDFDEPIALLTECRA